MIGYLNGEVIDVKTEGLIVSVNGVGYQVNLPAAFSHYQNGDKCELFIYTYVREDALELFGFKEKESKELFIKLLSVSGIGPKVALSIISTLSPKKFAQAIINENINVLKQVNGIGPKSGQRLILELKDKLDDILLAAGSEMSPETLVYDDELYSALNNLGYKDSEINQAVNDLGSKLSGDLEDKIMQVLNYLGKE
ncbi:MAG: Holliday junction branch migration protein RuvA [Halarsenatibacteraceae bacterium]